MFMPYTQLGVTPIDHAVKLLGMPATNMGVADLFHFIVVSSYLSVVCC